jgi:hypothetical protein
MESLVLVGLRLIVGQDIALEFVHNHPVPAAASDSGGSVDTRQRQTDAMENKQVNQQPKRTKAKKTAISF